MTRPTVSVIIPYFNAEMTLVRAIESVLNQSYPILEIILVDNNSSDTSREIAGEYLKKQPDKFILLSEEIQNANAARNKGLHAAHGEWLQFLDADDELMQDKISFQIKSLKGTENVAFIVSPFAEYYYSYTLNDWKFLQIRGLNQILGQSLINCQLGYTCSNLWHKLSLIKINGWNTSLSNIQEYDLMLRLLIQKNNFIICNYVMTHYLHSNNSISNPKDQNKHVQYLQNRLDYFEKVRNYLNVNELLNTNLDNKINDLKIKAVSNTLFQYFAEKKKVLEISRAWNINLNIIDKLKMYPHVIYSKYAFNTRHKYRNFAWHFLRNLYMLIPRR